MVIKTRNNITDTAISTNLTNLEVAGTNVLRWKNPSGFNASWAVQVGNTGEQQSEIVLLGTATPSGTAGTLTANTLYEHPSDTTLYATKFDQIVFERSITGTAGAAAPISGGTLTIQADQSFTQFDDTSGSQSYAYKTYFRNSALNVTSTESDWITPSGFTFYSLASMRQRVKDKLFDAGYISDDSLINNWLNEWLETMTNAAIDVNEGYSLGTANIPIIGTNLGTISNSDFKQLKRAWWVDGSGTYTAYKMDSNSFSPTQQFNSIKPYFSLQGDNIIELKPDNLTGTFNIEYYKLSPLLVNDTDEVPVVMKGYTKSFVNYGLAQALWKDSKMDLAKPKEDSAMADLQKFTTQISPAIKTGATYIDVVEQVDIGDTWI